MARAEMSHAGVRGEAQTATQSGDLIDDLSFLLARANALSLAAGTAALAPHGLRVRSYSVLALASGPTRPSQRDLAETLRLDPSQIVALVDRLEARGVVAREADPDDRRTNVVVATKQGRDLLAAASLSARAAERELHDELSTKDRALLTDLLRRLAFPTQG